jgi:hypothetical protein
MIAMRRFTLGSDIERKIVVIDVNGANLTVLRVKPDGTSKRQSQDLSDESAAKSAAEQLGRELLSRGYVEQGASGRKPVKATAKAIHAATAAPAPEMEEDDNGLPYDMMEEITESPQPVLRRLALLPVATAPPAEAPPRKKTGKKKKKKKAEADGLDKRVLAGVGAVGLVLLCGLGYMAYDAFLKPPTIVGTWRGSNIDYEIGGMITHTEAELILDENRRASMTLQGDGSIGTYSLKGDRLKLTYKDDEGESSEREFKVVLGRATLDLKEPETGKLIVQLIRFRETPVVGQKAETPAAPTDVAPSDVDKTDPSADARLASVDFSPKDNAFKLKYPQGWEPDTGSRPDNMYSWAKFTKDSATIQVYADIAGSLLSGSDSSGQYPEGSEMAPVHRAHELYKRTAKEEFSDFADSKPALFKGTATGEGRISIFTANSGGLFGSKLRGYHVTLLSKDRRITVLCHCPEKEFPNLKPTFLAVCRSFAR